MAACAAFLATSAAAAITLADDLGRTVELAQPARRIVSLAPFLTELAFSAGVGGRVVGVSAFSDYPAQARDLPQVASSAGIALEPLAALHPDLVIAWADTIRAEDIARIERLGPAVFVARARRIDDAPRLLQAVARLAGADATPAAREFRDRIAALRRTYAARATVTALVEIWSQPLTTIGANHWIDEALQACGARNAFADLPGVAPQLDWELVYRRDPQVVVGMGRTAEEAAFIRRWRARPTLAAVRAGHLVYVDADFLQRPTLRLAQGIAQLCEGIDRARR
ncbi:MAG TPA: helical backbone metal receptor [Usitatibacter sp.]|nr:helical backbone metal receptor [Usitatibacter sp.]